MKYSVPALLALCQDTDVHCKWTREARHCRLPRPGQSHKPILSEIPQNYPTRERARVPRPKKIPRSLTKISPSRKPPPPFPLKDGGFTEFLETHRSPTNRRVNAGGKIVPMEQPRPTRLVTSYLRPYETANPENPAVVQGWMAHRGMTGHRRSTMKDNSVIQQSSGEIPSAFIEPIPSCLSADVTQLATPIWPHTVPTLAAHAGGYTSTGEPLRRPDTDGPYYASFRSRWEQMSDLISQIDDEIGAFMSGVDLNQLSPFANFYCAFVQVCAQCGGFRESWAQALLQRKLSVHEMLLSEIREVIAFDPSIKLGHVCYEMRIDHTSERGKVLDALEELEVWRTAHAVTPPDPAARNTVNIVTPPVRRIYGHPSGNMALRGSNRRVAIINPDTRRPIQIPGQPAANGGNVPDERNGPRPLADIDGPYGWSDTDIVSWIASVDHVKDDNVSDTSQAMSASFGGITHSHESVLPSGNENDKERLTAEGVSTDGRGERSEPDNKPDM
ncbi:hypothetical protein N7535_008905 [Penicillium sp. DV-2018c]|nr:hypothetical protein N7535_008905 [Penicillium sp. DV-2018c]